jgi:drug/metabolite transporter (DMT)-like permease
MSAPLSQQVQNTKRGVLLLMSAMALFIINDSLVKLASRHYPVGQILVVRGIFACLIMFGIILAGGHLNKIKTAVEKFIVIRAGAEAMVALLFITALSHLPIGDLTAIMQTTSILIVLVSAVSGMQRVGLSLWVAVIMGFCGVLLMVKPGASDFNIYTLIALLTTVFVASRDLITRKINPTIPTAIVSLTTTLSVVGIGLVLGTQDWVALEWLETLYLVGAAVFVTLGNLCAVKAQRIAPPATLSPFRYSILVWAFLSGSLIFGEWPDFLSLIGSGLIVGAGLLTLHSERKKSSV